MNTLLLIDGNAIMHRAYHALPPMVTQDGTPTNAVYGFFNMLYKSISDLGATHVIVCFDTPTQTFRKKLLKEYQAHRPKMEETMSSQFPLVMKLLDAAGIKRLEMPGFEADDVIGTIAEQFKKEKDTRIFILTGDKDIMQLVDKNVFVITPLKGVSTIAIYNEENVFAKLGVQPTQIPDLKALMGDPSDNYKGAKGIGPKTAVKLLNQFQSVENMLGKIDQIKEDRTRSLIQENVENIELSKQLATISRNIDVSCEVDECEYKGFKNELKDELQKLEHYTLIGRLFGGKNNKPLAKKDEKKVEKKSKKDLHEESKQQLDLF